MVGQFKGAKFDTRFVVVSSILLVVLLACFAMATMSSNVVGNQGTVYYSNALVKNLTFNVSATFDLTQVNFSLPVNLNFTRGTNATTSANGVFTNITSDLSLSTNLSFGNTQSIVVANAGNATFTVGVTALADGTHLLNLITTNMSWGVNYTNYTIIFDTINPTVTNLTNLYRNLTTLLIPFNFTINDTNLNYTTITLYNNVSGVTINTTTNVGVTYTNFTNGTISSSVDGQYRLNATTYDKAGRQESAVIYVTVDSTVPAVTSLSPANGTGINSNTANLTNLTLSVSVYDSGVGLNTSTSSVIFTLYFANYTVNNTFNAINTSTNNGTVATRTWSYTGGINISQYPEGRYVLGVNVTDALGNKNTTEIANITIDKTSPSAITATEVRTDQTSVNFSIAITDALSSVSSNCIVNRSDGTAATVVGTSKSQSAFESALTCNTEYTYAITCNDSAGNINNTATYVKTTTACTAAASTGSSGSASSASDTEITSGVTKSFSVGQVLGFTAVGSHHTFVATTITANNVTVKVTSTPQYATLVVGEEKKFDLNADNTYDVSVKLNSITGTSSASMTVKAISEAITPTTDSTTTVAEESTPVVQKVTEAIKSVSSKTYWWVAAVIVILAIVLYLVFRRKN